MSLIIAALLTSQTVVDSTQVVDVVSASSQLAKRISRQSWDNRSLEIIRKGETVFLTEIKLTSMSGSAGLALTSLLTQHELLPVLAEALSPALQELLSLAVLSQDGGRVSLSEVKSDLANNSLSPLYLAEYLEVVNEPASIQLQLYSLLNLFKGDPLVDSYLAALRGSVLVGPEVVPPFGATVLREEVVTTTPTKTVTVTRRSITRSPSPREEEEEALEARSVRYASPAVLVGLEEEEVPLTSRRRPTVTRVPVTTSNRLISPIAAATVTPTTRVITPVTPVTTQLVTNRGANDFTRLSRQSSTVSRRNSGFY